MSASNLEAACSEFRHTGSIYLVDHRGSVYAVSAEAYASVPAELLRRCAVCLTRETMEKEVASRMARRCQLGCCAP